MFKYSLDNKRYHTLNYYYRNKYGKKVFKVSLNANFSCPNKINGNGCIFCSKLGSGDFAGNASLDLITQFNEVKEIMEHKWPDAYYIGYFQASLKVSDIISIRPLMFHNFFNLVKLSY